MMSGTGDMLVASAQLGDRWSMASVATISLAAAVVLRQNLKIKCRHCGQTKTFVLPIKVPMFSRRCVELHQSQANTARVPNVAWTANPPGGPTFFSQFSIHNPDFISMCRQPPTCTSQSWVEIKQMKLHPKAKAPVMKWSLLEASQVCSQPIDKQSGSDPLQNFLGNDAIFVRTIPSQDLRSEQFSRCTGSKWDACRRNLYHTTPLRTIYHHFFFVETRLVKKMQRHPYMGHSPTTTF